MTLTDAARQATEEPLTLLPVAAEPDDVSPGLPIPGEPYSFGGLALAQAVGDFESLNRTGRRALHLRLPRRDPEMLRLIGERLIRAD